MAQLGARVNGIHEVTGSIPVWSTILRSRELTPKRELRLGEPGEGCRAVAAKPRRRALRLVASARPSPCANPPLFAVADRGTCNLRSPITHIPPAFKSQVRHWRCLQPACRKTAIRLRSQECRSEATLLRRLHLGRPRRLADHNAGRCPHTARYRPWQLHVVIEFQDEHELSISNAI